MAASKLVGVALGAVLLSACAAPQSPEPSSDTPGRPAGTTLVSTAPTTDPPLPATTEPPAAPPAAASWVMPNLVGQNLQEAQDAVQSLTDLGIFFTTSNDATGQNRAQLVDSNWLVCSQSVAAGATITVETKIEFGAVKLAERCP